jgi:hypothetical protein
MIFMMPADIQPQIQQEYNISERYNTKLSSSEEIEYQDWRSKLPENLQNEYDYDLRGLWKENGNAEPSENLHFPDKYKKPNHFTFSEESIYSKEQTEGGKWVEDNGKWKFYASYYNLTQHSREELEDYFDNYEKDSELILPPELKFMATPRGEVYGFVTPEGDVYLDPGKMNANTPIHEFGHLWNDFVKKDNPELWARGGELIKNSPYWERVNGNPAYAGLSEEAKVDEALAMAIGDRGETVIRESGIGAKLRAWLNEVWEWLGSKLGIRNLTAGQIENLTLEDFVSGAVADLLGGKFIGDLESSQKNGIFAENNNRVYDSQGRNRPSESARGNAVSDGSSQGQQQSGNEVLVGNAADELRSSIEAAGKELPGLSKQEVNDLEKRKTLEYAKENGLWIDDLYSLGRPFPGGGNENTLALDEKTGTVFKSNNLFNYGDSIQNLLNAVRIHNELFPETRYDLVGFTGIDNGATRTPYIEVILKQKHVPDAGQATPTEIAGFMQSLGFERVNGHTFTNGRYTVSDMHPRNVLKNAAGDIFVVDDIITANGAGEAVGNLENSEKNGIFAKENNYNGRKEGTETGLGHGRRMGESALRGLVGEQSQSSGILEAIAAGYGRGGDGTAAQTGQGGWQKERFLGSLEIAARSNGTWIDDIHSIAGKPIAKGQENEVYRSKDGKKVIKVNNLSLLDAEHGFDDFIDRLRSHNELFGKEIPYRITGFTENSLGEVSVVLEQPYVRAEREATQEEIDDYLESKGFRETTLPDGMPGWTNGEYEIWDAEPRNVLADRDDNLYFIDTVVNSRRRGAERERGQYVIQYASQPDYDFDVSGITEANAREMRAIKEAAVGNGTFMKAPNRKPTKLNERQWLQMRTEAFKGWFGDWENNPGNASKIVDENGEPLAVYHGGLNRFTEFRTQSQYISYSNPDTGQEEKFFWSTDGSLGEGAYFTSDKDFAMQYTGGGYGKMGDKGVLYEVFLNIRNPYEGNYNNEYKEKSDAEAAGFDGSQDTGNDEYVAFSPNQIKSATSNNGNFDEGSGDIRFQFIGEQGAANLDRAQEANTRMDNLNVARGMEAAFAEKKARIRRLRESVPIEIAGNEIAPGKDLREYRKNANQYGLDHLRDVYTNRDTGNEISVTKGSIKEVTSHDLSKEQLQSVAAIPQIIENGIYIETLENEDRKKHFDVDSYDYYVAGLKIGGTDYTVKAAIANSKSGERYYDHSLTRIEKGRLILEAHAIGNHGQKSNSLSGIKDTKLLSILQMNEEESARRIKMATGWERGADRKWRYETADIEVNENLIKTGTGDISSLPLEDVISNSDGLFSAYPQLKRIMVKVEEFDFGGAYWNEAKQEIVFNAKYFYANNKERNRGSIIHEIQHAIQDTEGFASGGNSERFGNVHNPDAHKKWSDTLNAIRYIKDFGFYKGSVYSHSLSDFAREQVNSVSRMKPENAIKKLQIQADEYMAKANVFDREAGYDKYRRAAGEVEARNASRRMDMTAAQRRATLVRETEDVAREDQIFIYDAMGERRSADIREIDPLRIPNGYDAVYVRSTNELMLPDRGRMRVLKPEGRRLREVMPEALIRETAEILEWEC